MHRRLGRLLDRIQEEISAVPGLGGVAGQQAQALLERLLFLYFVQKKGLLDAKFDYFRRRFGDGHADRPTATSFYRQVLYPLMLATTDGEANHRLAGSVGAVPLLGEGFLDSPAARPDLPVSNATFQAFFDELLDDDGRTLAEGIEPDLLGQLFERLVLDRAQGPDGGCRRATGSYYTPRPVVAFMVREAVAEVLAEEGGPDRQAITRLLDLPPAGCLDARERAWLAAAFAPASAWDLRQRLLGIRACDPAAGAGAFLIGLLQMMAKAVGLLDWRLGGDAALGSHNYAYDVKKRIVERCLFGVDLQARAVEICKVRLWLDLLADYELPSGLPFENAVREVPTLDSLACRVCQGDSLLEQPHGTAPQEAPPRFSWRQDFSAVFEEKGGFDLLIGNPPYGARVGRDDWAQVKARYAGAGSARNLAAAFLVLPFDCLHPGGVACQIVPKSVSYSRGWSATRAALWDRGRLLASADASQAFEGVLLEQEVVLYRPAGPPVEMPRSWHLRGGAFVEGHRLPLALLKRQDAILNHLSVGAAELLVRLLDQGRPLSSYARTERGASWQSRLVPAGYRPGGDPRSVVPALRGRDIRQFALAQNLPGLPCAPDVEEKLRRMAGPKIVSQNIVAHVTRPHDTLLIVSALDRSGAAALDTVNMTTLRPGCPYPLEYFLGLLNSSLARWYFYCAVYNRAVRTMHLDAPYVDRFPVALASQGQVRRICRLVEELAARQAERETKYLLPGDDATYDALDQAVLELYALEPGNVERVLRAGDPVDSFTRRTL